MFRRISQELPKTTGGHATGDPERRASHRRRTHLPLVVSLALASIVLASVPMSVSATSYYGRVGYAFSSASCNSYARQVTVEVDMFANQVGQSMGRNLYVWTGKWTLLSSSWGTPDGSVLPFLTKVNVGAGVGTHYFLTEYFWYYNGWRSGSPASEQFSIRC
jgi:hypothetical protein